MKRTFLYLVVVLCFASPALKASAQDMSHEEEVVRNAYAKFSFLCSLHPLTSSIGHQLFTGEQIDAQSVAREMEKASPSFELSDFEVGDVKDIANDPWRDYFVFPQNGSYELQGQIVNEAHNDDGAVTNWHVAQAQWVLVQRRNPKAEQIFLDLSVAKIIDLEAAQWLDNDHKGPVNYTRYAAFTVNGTFQGRSSGLHKAIFFFGKDANGKEFVADNDVITGGNPVWYFVNNPTDLSGMLLGRIRENPVMAKWMQDHLLPASDCLPNSDLVCCWHGKCGLSPVAFNKYMSVPVPAKKVEP